MKNALLLASAILLMTLLSGVNIQASDETSAAENAAELIDEPGEIEAPDAPTPRPQLEKTDGDMSAVEVGDEFETSEILSIDDGGTSAADDDIEPQIQEAWDRGVANWKAIRTPLIIIFGYVLPAFFILRDRRVKLEERGLWLLATFAVSWLAFLNQ